MTRACGGLRPQAQRHAKISALLQLAAQARADAGVPTGEQIHLGLGDRTTTTRDFADIALVYRAQRVEPEQVIVERVSETEELR